MPQWQELSRNFGCHLRWRDGGRIGPERNVKRVFYVRFLNHPIYLDLIAARPEIRLDKLENDSPDADRQPDVAAAHAYQVEFGAR